MACQLTPQMVAVAESEPGQSQLCIHVVAGAHMLGPSVAFPGVFARLKVEQTGCE